MLTKPGIIRGNIMTTAAGFLLASYGHPVLAKLLWVVAGTTLVIASACVINNIIDHKLDKKMSRTKNRTLVTGVITRQHASIYAIVLALGGLAILLSRTNLLTFSLGIIGVVFYTVFYGYFKRRTVYGTEVGSISGAMPILAGYTAASGHLDSGALVLFLSMVFWQMPHFYAIALYRKREYAAAGLPLLPIVKGVVQTKVRMCLYIFAYLLAVSALSYLGYTGVVFAFVMILVSLVWLWFGVQGFGQADTVAWARRMFGLSLIMLLVFSFMISIASFLP